LQRVFGQLYLTKKEVEEMHLWPTIFIIFWATILVLKFIQGESGSVIILIALGLALYLIATFIFMPKTPQVGKTYHTTTFGGRQVDYNTNSDGSVSYTIRGDQKVIP
jgi:hypothetical protein